MKGQIYISASGSGSASEVGTCKDGSSEGGNPNPISGVQDIDVGAIVNNGPVRRGSCKELSKMKWLSKSRNMYINSMRRYVS